MNNLQKNIPLKNHTTLGIGGPAKFFITVKTKKELITALEFAKSENIPFLVIGGGSNLLVSDEGYPGLIIKNQISGIEIQEETLLVKSGTKLQDLVDVAIKNGLSGLQKLAGIPGTLGGAIYGNAGAYGQTISNTLEEVICLKEGEIISLSKKECSFDYRDSIFKISKTVILEAKFKLQKDDPKKLYVEAQEIIAQRNLKYPPNLMCPGSFFKNVPVEKIPSSSLTLVPSGKIVFNKIPAGVLLEEVGVKGLTRGQIQVAPYHANLVVNLGMGEAADFWQLAKNLSDKVKEKFNIILEPEVQFINLPPLTKS